MKRLALLALLACASILPAAAQERGEGPREGAAGGRGTLRAYANPSAAIAAELALDRDGAARGAWTALAAEAAPQAVVFTPPPAAHLAWAHDWLKGRVNPPAAGRSDARAVWSSCDGALILARGIRRLASGQTGWFARIWQRQADGQYKWLLSFGGPTPREDAEPDMILAQVADCPARPARGDEDTARAHKRAAMEKPKVPAPLDPLHRAGASPDGTLRWDAKVDPAGPTHVVVTLRKDGADQVLVDERVQPAT